MPCHAACKTIFTGMPSCFATGSEAAMVAWAAKGLRSAPTDLGVSRLIRGRRREQVAQLSVASLLGAFRAECASMRQSIPTDLCAMGRYLHSRLSAAVSNLLLSTAAHNWHERHGC